MHFGECRLLYDGHLIWLQVRKSKLKAIFVFVAPPSTEALEQRLRGRKTETSEQIEERMAAAREEIAT